MFCMSFTACKILYPILVKPQKLLKKGLLAISTPFFRNATVPQILQWASTFDQLVTATLIFKGGAKFVVAYRKARKACGLP